MTEKLQVCGKSIDIDWMVNYRNARETFDKYPNGPAICGNADLVAVFYQGTLEEVYRATWKCLEESGDRCFIPAGCEIPDGTSVENIHSQNKALREFQSK